MFRKLLLFSLACLTVSVVGQGSSCSRSAITRPLLRECSNVARGNSRLIDGGCFSSVGSVPPLRSNAALEAAAQAHAEDMARTGNYAHRGSDGSSPGERAVTHGYIRSAWAENIHRDQRSAFAAMRGWLCSSTHRGHLLSREYNEFGVGHACGARSCFHVQLFACSTGSNCEDNAGNNTPSKSIVPVNPPSSSASTRSPSARLGLRSSSPSPAAQRGFGYSNSYPSTRRYPPSYRSRGYGYGNSYGPRYRYGYGRYRGRRPYYYYG